MYKNYKIYNNVNILKLFTFNELELFYRKNNKKYKDIKKIRNLFRKIIFIYYLQEYSKGNIYVVKWNQLYSNFINMYGKEYIEKIQKDFVKVMNENEIKK